MKKIPRNAFEEKLRRKTWGVVFLAAAYGFLTSLFILSAGLYLYFIASYFWPAVFSLRIPAPFLISLLIAIPVITAAALGYWERLDAKGLTRKIEMEYPHLRDRLMTLVEISSNRQIESDPVSRAFAKSLEAEMTTLIDRFSFGRIFSPKRLILPGIFLLVCLFSGSVHGMIQPEFFRIGFSRLTHSEKILLPLKVETAPFQFQVVPGDTEIARGSNLLIEVTTPGYEMKQGEIYFRNEGESAWRIHTGKALGRDRFQVLLQRVASPGIYRAVVDGIQSPAYQVKFYEALRVDRVHWTLRFPSYMKLKDHDRQGWSGKLTVPRGTHAHIVFSFNRPVQNGWLLQQGKQLFPLAVKSPRILEADFKVEGDLKLTPQVLSEDGEVKFEAPEVWIQTLPDLAPYVEILEPQVHNYVFPSQEIPFEINANDDYGIRSVALVLRFKGQEKRLEWLPPGRVKDTVSLKPILKLEDFDLHSRDLIFAYLEVRDTFPGDDPDHVVRSPLMSFLIRDYVEQYKIRSPENDKPSIRQYFEEILAEQEKIMSDTWDYITLPPKDQPLGWEAEENKS